MALDSSFARAVSRRNLADWIAAGGSFERALTKLLGQVHGEVQTGRPPTKVVKKALDQLSQLMKQSGLPGEVHETGGRRHEVAICMPEAVGDTVAFVLVSGSINGRNGAINLTRRRVLDASQHVLERLHQRLGTKDSVAVLREVYSCLAAAVAMDEAAQVAGARHWPLVTTNGLFVCEPAEGDQATVLVTWMRLDQLGKKWGRVADDLRAASSESGRLLEDREFCVELLRLHSWLLRPHAPGPDLAAMWWASRPVSERDEDVREFERSLAEQDVDTVLPIEEEADSASTSSEVEPGSAHLSSDSPCQPHLVKAREKYTGIVVQLRSTGARIVALRNGFFGVLRQDDRVADGTLGESTAALQLGARVTVEVLRVVGEHYTGPQSIVLQLPDIADAVWSAVQQRHAVGSIVSGSIVWRGVGGSVFAMRDGASGWLPDSELTWSHGDRSVRDSLFVGQEMQLQVVGYAHRHRRLLLSLRGADGRAADRSAIEAQSSVGAIIEGSVVWVGTGGAVIGMPDGSSGWLPDVELSWSRGDRSVRHSFVIGKPIRLRVVGYDSEHRKHLLSLRQVDGHPIDRVDESAFVGTTHRGVVSNVVDYGVFVRLPTEFDGLLHRSDMPEGLSPMKGDVLDVRVTSIDKERRRVGLAYVGSSDQRPMTEKSERDDRSAAQ